MHDIVQRTATMAMTLTPLYGNGAGIWTAEEWHAREERMRQRCLRQESDEAAFAEACRAARRVLQQYSTSFFLVTRFLPAEKRRMVEAIYAAVRYPDEIVDTFPLEAADRDAMLDAWAAAYEQALGCAGMRDALSAGAPVHVAAFADVVRRAGIPEQHYRDFIAAMRHDVRPRPFADLADLVDHYIYGSAIVVGYFLTHVYGPARDEDFGRALQAARDLGIALQLTNFLRDVREDQRRDRQYIPVDMLAAEGLASVGDGLADDQEALARVLRRLAQTTEQHYAHAAANVDAFAPDSRVAIRACIDVYRRLNDRIGGSADALTIRASVPITEKFRALPSSKYWRLPLAYLGW
jgi:phytoene synthase